ncbi:MULTISPECIES: ESPR domain-containing protein [unclassified Serratia (in: enterobacteria)]
MNRIYRIVFNCALGLVQVASELARGAGKSHQSSTVVESDGHYDSERQKIGSPNCYHSIGGQGVSCYFLGQVTDGPQSCARKITHWPLLSAICLLMLSQGVSANGTGGANASVLGGMGLMVVQAVAAALAVQEGNPVPVLRQVLPVWLTVPEGQVLQDQVQIPIP